MRAPNDQDHDEEPDPPARQPPPPQSHWEESPETGKLAEELARRLQVASTLLMDRLFEYLATLPQAEDGSSSLSFPQSGLTLPASALGWLSSQIYRQDGDDESVLWMGAAVRDRLALLKFLLPRTSHLRVTREEWPPPIRQIRKVQQQEQSSQESPSMVGHDVSFSSNMSIQSALTLETHAPSPPNLRSFLLYCYDLQNRPRVDLRLFSNLQALVLEQVPPEWVQNLHMTRASLRLLRTDRGCIYNLSRFLFAENCNLNHHFNFEQLTHLKLTHCAIGELSGLRGKKKRSIYLEEPEEEDGPISIDGSNGYFVLPPMSRLSNLVSLSLAHNEIRTTRTALAGLSSLPNLRYLDLSFNRLTSFRMAHMLVGNIQSLILTGNRIQNVRGLDRLFSLEHLALDQNNLCDVASVAALANLPVLSELELSGNPLVESDPKRYRVEILNLFRESRFNSLPTKATYRHLLEILPVLDGLPASNRELVGLRGLSFVPSNEAAEKLNGEAGDGQSTSSTPTVSNMSLEVNETTNPNEIAQFVFESKRARKRRSSRVIKHRRARHAKVHDEPEELYELKKRDDLQELVQAGLQNLSFSTADVVWKLAVVEADNEKPASAFSDAEEEEDLDASEDAQSSDQIPVMVLQTVAPPSVAEPPEETVEEKEPLVSDTLEGEQRLISDEMAVNGPSEPPSGLSFISVSTVQPEKDALDGKSASMPANDDFSGVESHTSLQSPGKSSLNEWDDRKTDLDAMKAQNEMMNRLNGPNISAIPPPRRSIMREPAGNLLPEPDLTSFDQGVAPEEGFGSFPQPEVSFPEDVWEEDRSGLSSLGSTKDDFPEENKYQLAEENSLYDGPANYMHLPVLVNLELYFRYFVFAASVPEKYQSFNGEELSTEERSKIIVELAPRIQLRASDRKVFESSMRDLTHPMELLAATERFHRVWKEDLLACGKAAARRLTPHRTPKRGFHGDVLFSSGRLEKSCNCRKVIMCTTKLGLGGVALYLISDYDAFTNHALAKRKTRKFPSPIPQNALFGNGPWPHAVARHLIVNLNRITIGFEFQRLILHFSNDDQDLEEFTYVVLTCNKMRTISLLKQLQDHVKETGYHGATLFGGSELTIDNDDRMVLEALSTVVAPDVVGVVLHYQIVEQRWKHGDRGTVRRACVVTDTNLYLLDEDYVGDGSESFEAGARNLGDVFFTMVDSSAVEQITEVQAAHEDPTQITIVIKPLSRLQRIHRWRLVCRDSEGAERLVEDVRKAMSMLASSSQT